jgi:hypothetical protein
MSGLILATVDYWRVWIWELNQVQKGSEEGKYLHRGRIGSIEMGNCEPGNLWLSLASFLTVQACIQVEEMPTAI